MISLNHVSQRPRFIGLKWMDTGVIIQPTAHHTHCTPLYAYILGGGPPCVSGIDTLLGYGTFRLKLEMPLSNRNELVTL